MWYAFLILVISFALYPLYRLKVIGKNNLSKQHGYIIAPNHVAAVDPVLVAIARFVDKKMVVFAKDSLFKTALGQWFFSSVGCVAVQRGKGDTKLMDNAIAKVKNGTSSLIFPEGTRSKTGEMGKVKSGAFVMAIQSNVNIVPCYVKYKNGNSKIFSKAIVVFDEEININDYINEQNSNSTNIRSLKDEYMKRMEALKEKYKHF